MNLLKLLDGPDRPSRILIVDDEVRNRELLEVMLGPEGFVLLNAASGAEALAIVASDPPDLILLDVMMPGMDGYEVATKIKADLDRKNIPIIIVTALDDRGSRMLGLTAGAEDILSKPVDRAELCMRVRNLLRLKAYGAAQDKYGQMLEEEVGMRTAALIESERLYRSTFDAAPIGIAHVGLDRVWLRVNQRVCDLFGRSREEMEGARITQFTNVMEAERDTNALQRLIDGSQEQHVIDEREFFRPDGTSIWSRVNVSIHRDVQLRPVHFIVVLEDITQRRALEAQVRQSSKMDAIGRLASGVAHDFNNILSIVLSYSEMLAADLKEDDPVRADLEEIKTAGLRAVDLTQQLLAFSRKQVLQPKIVDLTDVVAGMERMLKRLLGEDVELITAGGSTLGKILVDPGQMTQVIMNLAVNARDAMPRGGKLKIETADVILDEDYAAMHVGVIAGPHVKLSVSDNGIGMDAATQGRMFEPFYTTKGEGKGTGLGLATVFGIVEQSGGRISVSSELGAGTTFTVYFPLAEREAEEVGLPEHSEVRRTHQGSETILLVEDEERVRVLARTILRKYGYEILESQNAGDALLLCEQHASTIHLLLTDVVMPRMGGRKLAERLHAVRPGMKVLYMSGYMDDEVVRHGVFDSTIAFLQKPITPDALAAKVRDVLDSPARPAFSFFPKMQQH